MKKIITTILVLAMLAAVLVVPAAASFENSAKDLNDLGLFRGTGGSYELDRAPTRAEAAAMLVRLLGKETEALAEEYEHPFTDVPDWADKYVGYLYENGLTTGVSSTEFGPDTLCDVRMYTTFVLRALGYFDYNGDFTYADAVNFGKGKGVIDDYIADGEFLRGNMVAVSMLGLKAQPKDKSADTLLDKLVEEDAVTTAAAKPILDRFAAYDEYIAAAGAYNSANKMDVDMTMSGTVSMSGMELPFVSDMCIQVILEGSNLQMAVTGSVSMMGTDTVIEMYYKDGYFYTNANGVKTKMPMDMNEALEQAGGAEVSSDPFYAIKNIVKTTSGGNKVYSIEYVEDFLYDMVASALDSSLGGSLGLGEVGMSMVINAASVDIVIDSKGNLVSQIMDLDVDMVVDIDGEEMELGCKYSIGMDIVAVGDSVKVTFPSDLNTYVEAE